MANKFIGKTFLTGKISATLIIPIEIAHKHRLNEPSNVIIEDTDQGIIVKRLEIQDE
jgi:bifunctional DNA-binding transcriptional regulator/antitoxin component of YhaV-PrlF toxin-antitoxin module